MFNHEDNSITNVPSRRFDLSMSKRTRMPKIFTEEEEDELEKKEDDQASFHRSSLKELMTVNNSRRKLGEESIKSEEIKAEDEDEVVEMERLDRGETEAEKSSNFAIVTRKGSFVGKYMKVLKQLIKANRDPVRRRALTRLPEK